jgi:hypothetical protein
MRPLASEDANSSLVKINAIGLLLRMMWLLRPGSQ